MTPIKKKIEFEFSFHSIKADDSLNVVKSGLIDWLIGV